MTKKQIEKKAKELCREDVSGCNGCCDECVQEIEKQKMIDLANWALSHQWVSVEEKLPPAMSKCDPISDRVLVHTSSDCVFVDHYDHYSQEWIRAKETNYATGRVTHWMAIPPLAEEGGEK